MIAPVTALVAPPGAWPPAPDAHAQLLALAERAGWPALPMPGLALPFGGTQQAWEAQVRLLSPLGIAWARAALQQLPHFRPT